MSVSGGSMKVTSVAVSGPRFRSAKIGRRVDSIAKATRGLGSGACASIASAIRASDTLASTWARRALRALRSDHTAAPNETATAAHAARAPHVPEVQPIPAASQTLVSRGGDSA